MSTSARWIWTPLREYVNQHVYFRKRLVLTADASSAAIRVTADTRYRLFVNGKSLVRGPARGFPHSMPIDELEIAGLLHSGVNVIAVHALSFGVSTAQNVFRDRAGFYLQGRITCHDGSEVSCSSNHTWRYIEAPGYRRYVSRTGSQTGFQEHFDAARESAALGTLESPGSPDSPAWTLPEYDDATWHRPKLLGAAGVLPWRTFEPRGIPALESVLALPLKAGAQCEGLDILSGANPEDSSNVCALVAAETRALAASPSYENTDGILLGGSGNACTLKAIPGGRCVSLLADFGETRFGYPVLKLSGAAGGEIFDLVYGEHAGELGVDPEVEPRAWARTAANENSPGDRLTCQPGANLFETLQPRGFRYMMLVARNVRQPIKLEQIAIRESTYPAVQRGRFECSDSRLNVVWETGVRTLRHCMADTFMDSPGQSQEQGWAAARIAGMTSFYALGDSLLYKRGLHLMAKGLLSDGMMFGVTPSERPDCVILDYCLHWIQSLSDYYGFTGDIGVLKEHRNTLEKVLSFFAVHAGERGLLGPAPNYSIFLDFAPGLDRGNVCATFNLLYLQALRRAADIGNWIGDSGLANHCARQATALSDRIMLVFASSNRHLLVESVDVRSGEPGDLVSQHATALAVLEGILGKRNGERNGAIKDVLTAFLDPPGAEVHPGPIRANLFFRAFVHEALATQGHLSSALDDIRRTWGYMLDQGATTWWERLPMHPGASRCHAWSTHPTSFLSRHVLGLQPMLPGWKRFGVATKNSGLTHASGKVPTPFGEIEIRWEASPGAGKRKFELQVPVGTEALVRNADNTPVLLREGSHHWEERI